MIKHIVVLLFITCFVFIAVADVPAADLHYTVLNDAKLYDRKDGSVVAVFPKYFGLYLMNPDGSEWVQLSSGHWVRSADFVKYPLPSLVAAMKEFSGEYKKADQASVSFGLVGGYVNMISRGTNYLQKVFYFRGRVVEFSGNYNSGVIKIFGRNVYPRAEFPQEMMGKNPHESIRRDGTFDFNGNTLFTVNLQRINEREILVNGIRFQLVQKWD